jgi:hypothetical protein
MFLQGLLQKTWILAQVDISYARFLYASFFCTLLAKALIVSTWQSF